jgi:3D (Asp-Asp-Asp) domain-containing protein
VIVTVYEPTEPEHDSVEVPIVAVPVSVIPVGEVLHVRPVGGGIVIDNETVPARP